MHPVAGVGLKPPVRAPSSVASRAIASTAQIVALLAALAVPWFGMLGQRALVHSDEGRYATLALGMLESGDWVTPRLDGLLYFEKPVFSYWAGALAFHLFGVNEFAARLWPALAGYLTVVVIGCAGARLWGRDTGLRAAAVAASATWMVGNSHFLTLDMGLTLFLTAALCAVLLALKEGTDPRHRRRWAACAWAAMALAVLTKGLVGVLIPGAALAAWSAWERDASIWRRLHWKSGVVIATAIAAPWFVVVSLRNPGYAEFFFVHEHVARYLTNVHHRAGAWWYFVPLLLLGLLPWTSALPWLGTGTDGSTRERRLLISWSAVVFLFFSASGSKLPPYILPMFPALALLIGHALRSASARALKRHLGFPVAAWVLAMLIASQAGHLVPASVPADAAHALARATAAGATAFLCGAAVAAWLLRRGRVSAGVVVVAFAHLCALLVVMQAHDASGRLISAAPIAAALRAQRLPEDAPVYAVRDYDQTLPFYLRRPVVLVAYVDEFDEGERREAQKWIPTLPEFVAEWRGAPQAIAYLSAATLHELQGMGFPARVVFQDGRRVVVARR